MNLMVRDLKLLIVFMCLMLLPAGCSKSDNAKDSLVDSAASEDASEDAGVYNLVDYSVVDGTVTTVSKANPGQSYIDDYSTFKKCEGYMFTVDLPANVSADGIVFKDDYAKRKLTIICPLETLDGNLILEPKGILNYVSSVKCKQSDGAIKLTVTFAKTFCFHYCVKDGVLYVKYGAASKYYDRIVCIDFGHGGEDIGAMTYDGVYVEKNAINGVMKYLVKDYESQQQTFAFFTRTKDNNMSLRRRANLANDVGADVSISLHCNFYSYDASVGGVETMYNLNDTATPFNSEWLATKVQEKYCTFVNLSDRGILDGSNLVVLRNAKMPACLLEMGFISGWSDQATLFTDEGQESIATTVKDALEEAVDEIKREGEADE